MTAEELIIAVTAEAHVIPPVAYKLLWGVISLAIQRGSGVVQVSMPWLAMYTGASRAGIAIAIGQLRKYVEVDSTPGKPLTFKLPEDWLPPQGPLFGGSGPITARRPRISTVITTTPSPPPTPSRNQATDQAGTNPYSRQVWPVTGLPTRPLQPGIQAAPVQNPGCIVQDIDKGTRARADQIRSEVSAVTEEYLSIRKAFRTVEIRPDQREDADILTEILQGYRSNFDSAARAASRPNRIVLARLLAIAAIEELSHTIYELQAERQRPGKSDMWFFTVLLERIRGFDRTITASVIEQEKSKAPFNESRGALFEDQLLADVTAKARRMA